MGYQFNPFTGNFDIAGGGSTQVNSDWNATTGVAKILNKPTIQTFDQSLNTTDSPQFVDVVATDILAAPTVSWGYGTGTLSQGNPDGSIAFYDRTNFTGFPATPPSNTLLAVANDLWFYRSGSNKYKVMLSGYSTSADLANGSNVCLRISDNSFAVGQTISAAANTSALTASYSVTGANTTPLLNLSGTWNTTGVAQGILLNITDTASAGASRLLDVQSSGTSLFAVAKAGTTSGSGGFSFLAATGGTFQFVSGGTGTVSFRRGSTIIFDARADGTNSFNFNAGFPVGWNSDTFLARDAANTLAQRNGTNANTLRVYGTFSDASNGRRLDITSTTGGIFTLTATGNGTGASGNLLKLTQPILLPASSVTLATNGDLAFEATSNTTLTIRYRGSDGTTRSAAIMLI
jgi:hypothetical protein